MKTILLATIILAISMSPNLGMGQTNELPTLATNETPLVKLELTDGSQIFGTSSVSTLPATLSFKAEVDIPLEQIQSIEFREGGEQGTATLSNGDIFTLTPRFSSIEIKALFGSVTAEMVNVLRLRVIGGRKRLPSTLQKGLLLHYTFDAENEDISNAENMSRRGKSANTKWTSDGRIGGAMRFTGENSYITTTDNTLPMGDAPRTIAFWVKLGHDQKNSSIISYGAPYQSNQMSMISMDWRIGRNSIAFSQYGGVYVASNKMTQDRWYHVVYTYEGKGQHAFYIDGKFSSPQAQEIRSINTQPSGTLYIGSNALGSFLDGWLDEVMIYNRALSLDEIQLLYNVD